MPGSSSIFCCNSTKIKLYSNIAGTANHDGEYWRISIIFYHFGIKVLAHFGGVWQVWAELITDLASKQELYRTNMYTSLPSALDGTASFDLTTQRLESILQTRTEETESTHLFCGYRHIERRHMVSRDTIVNSSSVKHLYTLYIHVASLI